MGYPQRPGSSTTPLVVSSPFVSAGNRRQELEETFLEFFDLCVETTDDAEELWAYERLKGTYVEGVSDADDLVPGFFAAMHWAARQRAMRGPS